MRHLLLSLAIATASLANANGDQTTKLPNVLLIMADDVGSDAIGCYGGQSYPTPQIDALAEQGMTFSHAFSMPVCHPSRICLMTGRYPFRFGADGMRWGDFPKAGESLSIGNVMKRLGYETAVAGKWQLCMMKNDVEQPRRLGFDSWCLFGWHEGGRYNDPLIYQNGRLRDDTLGKYGPDLYVEFLIDFMEQSHRTGKPFFAYYPMALCHDVTDDLKGRHVAYYRDGRWMTYAEMIASMDDMVGRLIKAIDAIGVREDTLVLFTTDNGTPAASYLFVRPDGSMARPKVYSIRHQAIIPGGKGKHSDSGTRVPLIASWPGKVAAGSQCDALVDLTDLIPTFLELSESAEVDEPRDGISFAPLLLGKPRPRPRDFIYSEHRGKRSIRSRTHRLYPNGRFFDLEADPHEESALAIETLDRSQSLIHQQLSSQLSRMGATSPR